MKTKNVQQWLESSQRNVPYELDFFTPFKDMVAPDKPAQQDKYASKRKHAQSKSSYPKSPIVISSDLDKSSASSTSSASSSQNYKRRPRNKTREDHYEYKGSRKNAKQKQREHSTEQPKKHKNHKKRVKKDVVDNFTARNVSSNRLTLNKPGGIFQRGKASVPASRPAFPDLKFSERAFLRLKQTDNFGRNENVQENWNEDSRRPDRKDKKQQEQDARMSEYFRQLPPMRPTKDAVQVHPGADAAAHRPNIFQTPCPQRRASPELSSEPLIDVPLPGPAFLGFGERGPSPAPKSSLRKTASLTPISERYHHRNTAHRRRVVSADVETASELSHKDDTTASCTTDPRAKHSPTSNFQFAKAQQQRSKSHNLVSARPVRKQDADRMLLPDRQEEIIQLLRELQNRKEDKNVTRDKTPAEEQHDDLDRSPCLRDEKEAHKLVEILMGNSKVMDGEIRDESLHKLSRIIESMQNRRTQVVAGPTQLPEDTAASERQSDERVIEASDDRVTASRAQDQTTQEECSSHSRRAKDPSQDLEDPKTTAEINRETPLQHGPASDTPAQRETTIHASSHNETPARPRNTPGLYQPRTALPTPSSLDQLPVHGGSQSMNGHTSPDLFARPRIIRMAHGPGLYEQQARGRTPQAHAVSLPISRPGTSSSMVYPISRIRPHLLEVSRYGLPRNTHSPPQEQTDTSQMPNVFSHNAQKVSYNAFAQSEQSVSPWTESAFVRAYDEDIQMTEAGTWYPKESFVEDVSAGISQYSPEHVEGSSSGFRLLDEADYNQTHNESVTSFGDLNAKEPQPESFEGSADMPDFWKPNILY